MEQDPKWNRIPNEVESQMGWNPKWNRISNGVESQMRWNNLAKTLPLLLLYPKLILYFVLYPQTSFTLQPQQNIKFTAALMCLKPCVIPRVVPSDLGHAPTSAENYAPFRTGVPPTTCRTSCCILRSCSYPNLCKTASLPLC